MKIRLHTPKTLMVAALASVSAMTYAQSNVTVYGILDNSVRYADGLDTANAASTSASTTVASGVNTTSRLGFRGSEDLGGGNTALFNLESGLNLATGATANSTKLFDRAAYAGLGGAWGTLTLGRQTTVLADAVGPVDPLASRFASFNPNIGIAALSAHRLGLEYGPAGSSSGSYRLDNSVKYTGRFGGLSLRAMHAFGAQPDNSSKLSSSGLGLGFESGNYLATLAVENFKTVTDLNLKAYLGGISATIGSGKLSLTYGSSDAQTTATAKTSNKTLGLGGTLPLTGNIDLVLAHYQVRRSVSGSAGDGFNRTVAFLEYKLSRRSLVYAELDNTQWKTGYNAAGLKSSATGLSFGVKHSF